MHVVVHGLAEPLRVHGQLVGSRQNGGKNVFAGRVGTGTQADSSGSLTEGQGGSRDHSARGIDNFARELAFSTSLAKRHAWDKKQGRNEQEGDKLKGSMWHPILQVMRALRVRCVQ